MLTITAASLIIDDVGLHDQGVWSPSAQVVVAVALTGLVLGAAWYTTRRAEPS